MNRTIAGKDNTAFYVESRKATKLARISEDPAVVPMETKRLLDDDNNWNKRASKSGAGDKLQQAVRFHGVREIIVFYGLGYSPFLADCFYSISFSSDRHAAKPSHYVNRSRNRAW